MKTFFPLQRNRIQRTAIASVWLVVLSMLTVGHVMGADGIDPTTGKKYVKRDNVPLYELPPVVRTTLLKHTPPGKSFYKIHFRSERSEKGAWLYVAEIREGKLETKIMVDTQGKLVKVFTAIEDD